MPINLLSAGGGTTTLTTASSASNFTVTIPAATGSVITTAPGTSGNALISDGTNWTSSTVNGTAKAWVNFDGNTSVAIRASFNVSSVTRNTTGQFGVNFTNALADANYAANVSCSVGSTTAPVTSITMFGARDASPTAPTTTGFIFIVTMGGGFTNANPTYCCVSVFR
jgi:hypothetical protein